MKRCPNCRRDYHDDSLSYCLDDGAVLVDGPSNDEAITAILPDQYSTSEKATRTFPSRSDVTGGSTKAGTRPGYLWGIAAAVFALAAIGIYYFYSTRSANRQISSIAVMPFTNVNADPNLEYLSDGVPESLINSLSQVPELSIKARSSVFSYKGKDVPPQQVAKDLSVQAVLNGRVVQRGDQVLLNVELVDAGSGNQIWGNQYARKMTDLVRLQSDLARDVSRELSSKLSPSDQQKVAKNYTENTEAYQLYLQGRYYWNKRKREDMLKSTEFFQQAIDKDPTYALAYAGLADAYILMPGYYFGSPQEYYPKARGAAEKAIDIDPTLAEPHNALASVMSNFEWRFADAEAEWKRTLELNPNYATGHQWYAEHLLAMGRFEEALAEMRRAQELDPRSLIINGLLGVLLRINGQNEASLEQLQRTLEMDPNFPRTHLFFAEFYQATGRYEEAVDEFAKSFALNGAQPEDVAQFTTKVKSAYKIGGPKGYSRAMAELLGSRDGSAPAPPVVIAYYWINAGETDKAFAGLNKAYEEHSEGILMLKDGRLHMVESDPRYQDLLRRVGLPE